MDEVLREDVRFGQLVMLVSAALIAATVMIALWLSSPWSLIPLWTAFGCLSVILQVVTDFGYLRMVPRFDAVFSFSLSIFAGPVSLARIFWDYFR